jgi:hypothetical protein
MNIIERIGGKRDGNWFLKSESYNKNTVPTLVLSGVELALSGVEGSQ